MKKQSAVSEHNQLNQTYQSNIIIRALGDKGMKDLHDQYVAVKLRTGSKTHYPPTPDEDKLADRYAKGESVGSLAREKDLTYSVISSKIRRVALWRMVNGK